MVSEQTPPAPLPYTQAHGRTHTDTHTGTCPVRPLPCRAMTQPGCPARRAELITSTGARESRLPFRTLSGGGAAWQGRSPRRPLPRLPGQEPLRDPAPAPATHDPQVPEASRRPASTSRKRSFHTQPLHPQASPSLSRVDLPSCAHTCPIHAHVAAVSSSLPAVISCSTCRAQRGASVAVARG